MCKNKHGQFPYFTSPRSKTIGDLDSVSKNSILILRFQHRVRVTYSETIGKGTISMNKLTWQRWIIFAQFRKFKDVLTNRLLFCYLLLKKREAKPGEGQVIKYLRHKKGQRYLCVCAQEIPACNCPIHPPHGLIILLSALATSGGQLFAMIAWTHEAGEGWKGFATGEKLEKKHCKFPSYVCVLDDPLLSPSISSWQLSLWKEWLFCT